MAVAFFAFLVAVAIVTSVIRGRHGEWIDSSTTCFSLMTIMPRCRVARSEGKP